MPEEESQTALLRVGEQFRGMSSDGCSTSSLHPSMPPMRNESPFHRAPPALLLTASSCASTLQASTRASPRTWCGGRTPRSGRCSTATRWGEGMLGCCVRCLQVCGTADGAAPACWPTWPPTCIWILHMYLTHLGLAALPIRTHRTARATCPSRACSTAPAAALLSSSGPRRAGQRLCVWQVGCAHLAALHRRHRHALHGKVPCIMGTARAHVHARQQSCIHAQATCTARTSIPHPKADALGQRHLV